MRELSDHAQVRPLVLATFALCGCLACSSETPAPAPSSSSSNQAHAQPEIASKTSVEPVGDEAGRASELPPRASGVVEGSESGGESGGGSGEGSESGSSDSDQALALPEAPEPGSAKADAELLALLDESTLTQDEFDKGFGRGEAKLDKDEFNFGPDARKRGTPAVILGKVTGGAATRIEAFVDAERSKFERCLAMALSKDEAALGSIRLKLDFDAQGGVTQVRAEAVALGGGAELRESLTACLRSIPETWTLPEAASSSVTLPLTLSIEEA